MNKIVTFIMLLILGITIRAEAVPFGGVEFLAAKIN